MSSWESANDGRLQKGAGWYAAQGWRILPCHGIADGGRCTCNSTHGEPKDVGKHPAIGEWNNRATEDLTTVHNWWEQNPNYNVGVFCGPSGFLVIDVDPRSGGIESFDKFEELLDGSLPPTVEAMTGEYAQGNKVVRGRHLFYKCSPDEQLVGNLIKNGLKGIDIKHNGYVLIAPSRHFSGTTYDWKPGHAPWEMEMAEAPEELLQAIRKRSRKSTSYSEGSWEWLDGLEFKGEKIDIERLLSEGIEEGHRAVDIYAMACALANKYGTSPDARMMVETMMIRFNAEKVRPPMELEGQNSLLMHVRRAMDFVAENPKENRLWPGISDWKQGNDWARNASSAEAQAELRSGGMQMPAANTVGNTISRLVEGGQSLSDAINNGNLDIPRDQDAISEEDGGRPGNRTLTDTGNGRRLVDTYGSAVRYTPGLGWFHWDSTYWKPDIEQLEMQELAKRIAPVIASEVTNYGEGDSKQQEIIKWANQAKSNARIKNMITSANSDPRIVVGVEQWDGDAQLFGVTNGVIDLKTGELIKGRPDLYITRRAPVSYTPGLRNVRWEQFIDFATGGDKELQDWIQRAVGYTLTGLSNQDVLFLVYGPPGSGKNTFVETVVQAMGTEQYAGALSSEILAANDGKSSATDMYFLAELRGKRMIWVDELPETERLKENKVKQLTGSSTIQARSPGERPFTFKAQGKLWVTTNHRPMITDDAMWRRLRPIPWTQVAENPDPDLKAYLSDPEGGLPAVLSWAVEGAIKYLNSSARDPLGWCSAVRESADVYRKDEDRIGLFLDEETVESNGTAILVKSLFGIYRRWSEERSERPMSQIAFQRKLKDRGLDIIGQGSRAEIQGRATRPRPVPDSTVEWTTLTAVARNF
jgi:putative DNA primase/helicase